MGLLEKFYPSINPRNPTQYRNHCNCQDCHRRAQEYGRVWRERTPLCTCCDCMARAGQDIRQSYSTLNHTLASGHTCGMPSHSHPYHASGQYPAHAEDPPPRYSLMPGTTHKVDHACGSRYYATPLEPEVRYQSLYPSTTAIKEECACSGGGHPVKQPQYHHHQQPQQPVMRCGKVYDAQTYLNMPSQYRPCCN